MLRWIINIIFKKKPKEPPIINDDIGSMIDKYVNITNGQLRGSINNIAREENLQILLWGFSQVFKIAYELGRKDTTREIMQGISSEEIGN